MKNTKFTLQEGNEYKFTIDELKFILATSDKLLKTTFDVSNTIVTRSAIVLSAFLALFSAVGGYIISQINSCPKDVPLLSTSLFLIVYILYLYPNTIKNISAFEYQSTGSMPKDYLHDYYAGLDSNTNETTNENFKKREKEMLIAELVSFQTRIDMNQAKNKERWDIYNFTMRHIKFMPFSLTAFYLIAVFISHIKGC